MLNQHEQEHEQVYVCRECGSHWPETEIAVRPISKVLYCCFCQSERLRLVTEDDALENRP